MSSRGRSRGSWRCSPTGDTGVDAEDGAAGRDRRELGLRGLRTDRHVGAGAGDGEQVAAQDRRPVRDGDLDQADRSGAAVAEHRLAARGADVADPAAPLAQHRHQVPVAVPAPGRRGSRGRPVHVPQSLVGEHGAHGGHPAGLGGWSRWLGRPRWRGAAPPHRHGARSPTPPGSRRPARRDPAPARRAIATSCVPTKTFLGPFLARPGDRCPGEPGTTVLRHAPRPPWRRTRSASRRR